MYISFINFILGRNIGPSSLIFFNVKIIFWKKECQIYICKLLNFLPATRCLATVVCEDKMSAPSPADSSICQMSEVHAFTSRGFFSALNLTISWPFLSQNGLYNRMDINGTTVWLSGHIIYCKQVCSRLWNEVKYCITHIKE